ncbi:acireductone dioxygenase, putative [Bodo saltans]|uniref:Acireductone dioxygenase n=1 Tax=Bodo saltans TaxID=75058 RepID=A0A0S4JKP7_BODSA|nr:acireductone dioxygenase, putative [Bodo saltans]|eukprot:CUG89762.1 acireductone dioxygenase, putative [Bodo saltans]
MTEAWLMSDDIADQREENRRTPNVPVTLEELSEIGIFTRKLNPETMLVSQHGEPSEVDKIMATMGYKNRDEVCCAPGKLPDYENKIKMFFKEHIHEDEEIRLIADGTGYFDFRNAGDEWIRVKVTPGDFIVVPAGMYHRFTMDVKDYTHAIRLFSDVPRWIAIDRPCEDNTFRQEYVKQFITEPPTKKTILGDVSEDNILISLPQTFDAVVRPIINGRLRIAEKDLLVLYFTGTPNPKTGASWCPDCVVADPQVAEAVAAARKKRNVTFVECTVERGSYLKNPLYPYRVHPFIMLPSIPTVLVLEAVEEDAAVGVKEISKREDGSAEWVDKL